MITEPVCITLPLKPYGKKNSQEIRRNKAGIPFIGQSEKYERYERDCGWFIRCKGLGIGCPVNIRAVFYVPDRRVRDISNYINALADILVHYAVIEDDRWTVVAGWDGTRMCIDRQNPRTEVTITPMPGAEHQTEMAGGIIQETF
jgi:Holliday junction resolvase RusA-like endonuclease